jgi:hypothetical protein
MECYSAMKKNEVMSSAAKWMERQIIMLRKISQTQKDKYHMFNLMWTLTKMKELELRLPWSSKGTVEEGRKV